MSISFTPSEQTTLQGYAYWAKFVAICSYVFLGLNLLVILAYCLLLIASIVGVLIVPFYLLLTIVPLIITFIAALKLQASARRVRDGVDSSASLISAFESLRQGLKIYGLYQATVLSLYGLLIVGSVVLVGGLLLTSHDLSKTLDFDDPSELSFEFTLDDPEEPESIVEKQARIAELEGEIRILENQIEYLEAQENPDPQSF